MKKNVGKIDRLVRIILAFVLLVVAFAIPLEGVLQYVFFALGAILLVTAFVSFCPLYTVVGCNTCAKKAGNSKK
jgi:hypothetical protein